VTPLELKKLCEEFVGTMREYAHHEYSEYQMGPDPDPASELFTLLRRVAGEGVEPEREPEREYKIMVMWTRNGISFPLKQWPGTYPDKGSAQRAADQLAKDWNRPGDESRHDFIVEEA